MSQIHAEIQSLAPSALIEVFELNLKNTPSKNVYYFHAGTNKLEQPIVWQGVTYDPWPVEASGFDIVTQGTLPRPTIKIANVGGLVSAEVQANNDLVGATVIRRRTFARFLDAVNFPEGNKYANVNEKLPDESWFIEQKKTESRLQVEFELSSVFDLMGVQLPFRQVVKNGCQWQYRSTECGYTGPYMDKNNKLVTSKLEDQCAKNFPACKARQEYFSEQILPFGGFPGARRYGSYS